MTTIKEIFQHFKTRTALAKALGCTPQALDRWPTKGVPANAAIKIEKLTNGKFKAIEIPLYVDRDKAA